MLRSKMIFVCVLSLLASIANAESLRACGAFTVKRDYSGHKSYHLITGAGAGMGNDYALEAAPGLRDGHLADGENVCFTLNIFEHPYGPSYQVVMDETRAEKKSHLSAQVYEE